MYYSLYTKRKRQWYQKNTRKKRHVQMNNNKKQKQKHNVWLSGRTCILKDRWDEGPRLQLKHKDKNKAKQNKSKNTKERRHDICKPNARRIQVRATRGYYSQQGRVANQHEPACFGVSSPWSFSPRSAVVQLQRLDRKIMLISSTLISWREVQRR